MMQNLKLNNMYVQIIDSGEKQFIGVTATSSFQQITGIAEASESFKDRRNEIYSLKHVDEYVCVHFSNDVLFNYIYCMEVSELDNIPEEMIGFTVPRSPYAKVRSKDEDPYGLINTYLKENGMERNPNLCSFEIFKFGEEESKYNADILVPIKV